MFYLYATVIAASMMVYADFNAAAFAASLVLLVLYLALFGDYFKKQKKGRFFIPVVLASLILHTVFLFEMLTEDYIKDINLTVLYSVFAAVCVFIAFGKKESIINMAAPLFFFAIFMTVMNVFSGSAASNGLSSGNEAQLALAVVSPASVAFCLSYMRRESFAKVYPSFVCGCFIAFFFLLFDMSFFKSLTLTFISPLLLAVELYFIRTVIFPKTPK